MQVAKSSAGSLSMYLSEIGRYPLLSQDEERELARSKDPAAARKLVASNLRFVVKISYQYRSYGLNMLDLIQEGNCGLMKAVEKFDAERGLRLISYAVWWIRAYIQSYILRSWSLVKLGTTQAQRRLFFSLARARREMEMHNGNNGERLSAESIAESLNVRTVDVLEMEQRMEGRDLSLDAPAGDDGRTQADCMASRAAGQEETLSRKEEQSLMGTRVETALGDLDARERFIIEKRAMSDQPMTFAELGHHFGVSRERARQLELRARDKLKGKLSQLMSDIDMAEALPPQMVAPRHEQLAHVA